MSFKPFPCTTLTVIPQNATAQPVFLVLKEETVLIEFELHLLKVLRK
jgi:hypothetical protein